ncbi:DUF2993 domain-containing protein [Euhalothece natronophila Z-M001]|uniref:DUF2993 domain-containing protein n=1 Tax=Euhalothece natronophila Z-M001 TaxID=522448 RepID=A0A5B8NNP2_9CHRO|nr:DUF2993 domain-containing protein [Euhalothece natronophila]QDZ40556.1 DUF2993 domain-containing protein [Euhalothece natronophila Z-M001]
MLFSLATQHLGEQTLNKIATFALSTQLDESERLDVNVKTDPGLLAQGKLTSLTIDGDGLVMQKDLRMQKLLINLQNIAVSPMKALTGNIELTETSTGEANILLSDADINRAFNSDTLRDQMESLKIQVENEQVTLDVLAVECHFLKQGTVSIDARIKIQETGETQKVYFTTIPRISDGGRGVTLDSVSYAEGKELSPELTEALLEKARNILNLNNFEMEGISLSINQIQVKEGELNLCAIAQITKFPQPES